MKRILLMITLFIGIIYSQDYINVQLNTGYKHEMLSNLKEITFDGDNIKFEIINGSIAIENMNEVVGITFGNSPLGDQSLPVELSYFKAIKQNDVVSLNWKTQSEVNNTGFNVERISNETNSWETIGFVPGKGNSSTPVTYNFIDDNIINFSDLKYRLKQIDNDGTFEYSEEIFVAEEEIQKPNKFRLHNNYPNPFNPITTIAYELVKTGLTSVKIYDINGNIVQSLVNENQTPGHYYVTFEANEMASGVYFCRLTSGHNTQMIKMLLMK